MKNKTLIEYKINPKIILASLWASTTLCYIYGDYFELYIPNHISKINQTQSLLNTPIRLLSASMLMVVPSSMVFLSVILKAFINRILNIFFGIIYTGIMLLIAITQFSAEWREFYVFLAIVESIFTSLVIFYAWNWNKLNTK